MHAIHSLWSKPRISATGALYIEDFDLLTTILSALKWREKNGTISMITDTDGYNFYKSRNLIPLWDTITCDLDNIPKWINENVFWAGGKIFALNGVKSPVAAIDTDFIVWDKLAFSNLPDLTVIHSEKLNPDVYPDMGYFKMKDCYMFNPKWDWSINPFNTAFTVIKNETFKEAYCKDAIDFIKNADGDDTLTYMVFAEQRLMAMTAKEMNIQTREISTMENLFRDGERYFTHTWGMKQQMREMKALRNDFCRKCIRRITDDYPEFVSTLFNIPELKPYLK